MFYLLRPILFRTCRYFTGLCSSNIPRYFLDFALDPVCEGTFSYIKDGDVDWFENTCTVFFNIQSGICHAGSSVFSGKFLNISQTAFSVTPLNILVVVCSNVHV